MEKRLAREKNMEKREGGGKAVNDGAACLSTRGFLSSEGHTSEPRADFIKSEPGGKMSGIQKGVGSGRKG